MRKLVVAGLITRADGRVLITQRTATQSLPLQWEFPGGKVEDDEQDEDALKRELRERLDADAKIGRKLGEKVHLTKGHPLSQNTSVHYSSSRVIFVSTTSPTGGGSLVCF